MDLSAIKQHIVSRIRQTPVVTEPYPYVYIEEFFPVSYYQQILNQLPDKSAFTKLAPGYEKRLLISFHNTAEIEQLPADIQSFWKDFAQVVLSDELRNAFLDKFSSYVQTRFKGAKPNFYSSSDLLLDQQNYALGPHTDHPDKVISILFYLPKDASLSHLGTKIYEHEDPNFKDFAGDHHKFDGFRKVQAIEYKPNTSFAFFKTDNSFHGVEPVTEVAQRQLVLYNIRIPKEDVPASERKFVHGAL